MTNIKISAKGRRFLNRSEVSAQVSAELSTYPRSLTVEAITVRTMGGKAYKVSSASFVTTKK